MGFWKEVGASRSRYFATEDDYRRFLGLSTEQFHAVHDDIMEPTWHPATGTMIDSKSKFRRETKAAGCIEYGNEDITKINRQRKKEFEFDHYKVAKEIHDRMEADGISHKQVAKDCVETFRRLRNGENF